MAQSNDELHFLDYWQVLRSRKEVIVSFALIVVLAGVAYTFHTPKVYESGTIIQVKKDLPVNILTRGISGYDPLFLRTQFEIIQSNPIVEEVVERLDLVKKLSAAYKYDTLAEPKRFDMTCRVLSSGMKVQQFRDTDLIEIKMRVRELGGSPEQAPQLAADIANAISKVYHDQSLTTNRDKMEREIVALREELDEQNRVVEEADAKVEEIRSKYKITRIGYARGGSDIKDISLKELEVRAIIVRLQLEEKKAKYEKAKSLTNAELLAWSSFLHPDPALNKLVMDRQMAEVTLSDGQKNELGDNHPSMVAAKAVLASLAQKIQESLSGLKIGLQTDLEASQAGYNWLEKQLADQKQIHRQNEGAANREFNKAQDDLLRKQVIRDTLYQKYIDERISKNIPVSMVHIVEEAKAPDVNAEVSPDLTLNIILSIILGLGGGVALAYFTEYLDTSVKTIEDIERHMGVPVLGVIPQKVKPFNAPGADIAHQEAYRVLRTNVQFSKKLIGKKTMCVTSGSVGEGKSLTTFNLAYVSADLGDKVLLVDADLHRPKQHKMLGISRTVGLANILVGEVEIEDAVIATEFPNLDFLPSGSIASGCHGLMDNRRLPEVVSVLKENYDLVLFDAPPILGVSDTSLLIREIDGILLVVQHRKYPKSVSSRAKTVIDNLGANLVGVVLNNINISRDYSSYYYQSYTYGQKSKK